MLAFLAAIISCDLPTTNMSEADTKLDINYTVVVALEIYFTAPGN